MLHTTVVDPERITWKGEAKSLVVGLQDGQYGILPGHADAIFLVAPCILRIEPVEGPTVRLFVSGGSLRIDRNQVVLVANAAENKDRIDASRAQAAKERAEQRLQHRKPEVDMDRARMALQRSLLRLSLTEL